MATAALPFELRAALLVELLVDEVSTRETKKLATEWTSSDLPSPLLFDYVLLSDACSSSAPNWVWTSSV